MSINKNFTITREKTNDKIRASSIAIGDVSNTNAGKIRICNINTGSVWSVPYDECYTIVKNCKINYQIKS